MDSLLTEAKKVVYKAPSYPPTQWKPDDWQFAATNITLQNPIQQQALLITASNNTPVRMIMAMQLKEYIEKFKS
jgi:hypothetical protein